MSKQIRSILITTVLILSVAFVLTPVDAYARGSILNGSFETGDFTGWNVTVDQLGMAQVVTQYTSPITGSIYTARDGRYFAALRPGMPDTDTAVSQVFSAAKGDVISGWAFFKAEDYLPYNDAGRVEITVVNNSTGISTTVFSASVSTVGNFGGTAWTYWSSEFGSAGQYSLRARISNFADPGYPSCIGLDGVMIQSSIKPFEDGDSSPSIPAQSGASAAATKVLTASVQTGQVIAGQPVKIMANVANRGDTPGTLTVKLSINGQVEDTRQLSINGNSGKAIEFTVIKNEPGIYTVDVNGQKAYFTVVVRPGMTNSKTIVYIMLGLMVFITAALAVIVVRRRLTG